MAFLTNEEIKTHLKEELVNLITDNTDATIDEAIEAAIEEASGYLSEYDTDAIFAATGSVRNATLLLFVKDITVWHFIQLANPNIEMALREKRYLMAIEWLGKVQNGKVKPTLPRPESETPPPGKVSFGGTTKRQTGY